MIPPGATVPGGIHPTSESDLQNVISPANMHAVVNAIYNLSGRFTHKNGREDPSDAGVRRGGEPSTDAEGAAPSHRVKLDLCQFDRFAR